MGTSGESDEEEDPRRGHAATTTTETGIHEFKGEWDAEGVYVYQAFCHEIANYALEHQAFGGPKFNPSRMTWVKPSFAWVLYRSGYATKHNQERILKVKVPHAALATLLSKCQCKWGGGGSKGRVQWDPARDLFSAEGREPRKMLRERAIQIGLSKDLSEDYVKSVISIEDVTPLARSVHQAHSAKTAPATREMMEALSPSLPHERLYMPHCADADLVKLMMAPFQDGANGGYAAAPDQFVRRKSTKASRRQSRR